MENQINVGDQNTQQIGQNPVSQTVQTSQKPRVNFWIISTVVVLFFLLLTALYSLYLKDKLTKNEEQLVSTNNAPPPSVIAPTTFTPYIDVALSNLDPKYNKKRICLFGDYSVGREYAGFEDVWTANPAEFADYLITPVTPDIKRSVIACGVINYFPEGTGHLGNYKYYLPIEIMIDVQNEKPYLSSITNVINCNQIHGTNRKSLCYWEFALNNNDSSLCKLIDNGKIKDSCFLHVANDLSQRNLCQNINQNTKAGVDIDVYYNNYWLPRDLQLKEFCEAISSSKIEECDSVTVTEIKDRCLEKVASTTKNQTTCGIIKDLSTKMSCYSKIAIDLHNSSLCENLPESHIIRSDGNEESVVAQSICYFNYVKNTKENEVCQKIKDSGYKSACLNIK
jgi:hypothetical protein